MKIGIAAVVLALVFVAGLAVLATHRLEYYGFDMARCYNDGGFYTKGWCYLPLEDK